MVAWRRLTARSSRKISHSRLRPIVISGSNSKLRTMTPRRPVRFSLAIALPDGSGCLPIWSSRPRDEASWNWTCPLVSEKDEECVAELQAISINQQLLSHRLLIHEAIAAAMFIAQDVACIGMPDACLFAMDGEVF